MQRILGIVPARYGSSRFPGKPLVMIRGKSMVMRVYEQALQSGILSRVLVATDDRRIFDHVIQCGGEAVMTSSTHRTGTERCAEVAAGFPGLYDVIINIQGDEPFIDPGQIVKVAECFLNPEVQIATLAKKIILPDELFDPNVVKVVFDRNTRALLFSRHPIPYLRDAAKETWIGKSLHFKHIGIYAFKTGILANLATLQPSAVELAESLEQLRWMVYGFTIHVAITEKESFSVDTAGDLEKILKIAFPAG